MLAMHLAKVRFTKVSRRFRQLGWCRRGWYSILCKCNVIKHPRLPTPRSGVATLATAVRRVFYTNGGALGVLLKTRPSSDQRLQRYRGRK